MCERRFWGRGRFSERSASPQTPTPEERLGISLTFPPSLRPHASWARFPASWLWSRRLPEPPRPANVGLQPIIGKGRAKVSKGRSQSRQTGSVLWSCPQARNLASADAAHPRTVAAALSAAVTSTNSQESTPTSQAEPPTQKHTTQAPATLREGARGRRFS